MKIDINKDFEETFKNSTVKGFTLREVVTIAAAFGLSFVVVAFIWYFTGISLRVAVYFGVPVMLPIVFVGIFRYQGMPVEELIKEVRYMYKTRELACEAEEYQGKQRIFTMKSRRREKR